MIEKIKQIDWRKLGDIQVKSFLIDAFSEDINIRQNALMKLKDAIVPWELLEGYGSTDNLMKMARTSLHFQVIPFLIEILKNTDNLTASMILEILFDMARYELVDKNFIQPGEETRYLTWALQIKNDINKYEMLYKDLVANPSPEIQHAAQDLVELLNGKNRD